MASNILCASDYSNRLKRIYIYDVLKDIFNIQTNNIVFLSKCDLFREIAHLFVV